MDDAYVLEVLLRGKYITEGDAARATEYAKNRGASVLDYFFSQELLNKDLLGQAIAESFDLPYYDLNSRMPAADLLRRIPPELAREKRVVLVEEDEKQVTVVTDSPAAPALGGDLSGIFPGKKIKIVYALPEDIDEALKQGNPKLDTRFAEILKKGSGVAPEIVDQIIEDAVALHVSDVHIEPREEEVIVRFRIDGVLHEAGALPRALYETVINRIKVQARLRIDEHFSSQDGAIRFPSKDKSRSIDLRVSIVPTLEGEKIVIRILSSYVRDLTFGNIGLPQDLQDQILISAKKPFGMILVTGPTGSGKTTTLYSLIKLLNTHERNITTIEDPVEYKIQGVNQIQANAQTNLTFAQGLRAIARQDPNIILVGEIRDLETADIAVNAALTGHLLLSTFHANNAATAIPRFIDMGVEPFLVGSTLELVISQRLVRRICEACRVSYEAATTDLEAYGPEVSKLLGGKAATLYRGKGCSSCSHTGFKGRVGVYEFFTTSPELQDLIGKSPSTKEVVALVRGQGFRAMFEDGLEKVRSGVTNIDELLRVVAP